MIEAYLREQRQLTAVEQFAVLYDARESAERPALEESYRALIPSARPGEDEQYAFEVDLDLCTGCKACVTGCHNRNGLAEDETWRWTEDVELAVGMGTDRQTITTACHHCAEPGCLEGCPVLAYEKDEVTGIVQHLDDQCIGCQYCVMKCPYDVPRYDTARGIVRKCDMCIGRLAAGEAPACVQSCPNEAIRIVNASRKQSPTQLQAAFSVLPGAPDPAHTKPTTVYKTSRLDAAMNDGRADTESPKPAHAHLPLVWMLVATQISVGLLSAACLLTFGPQTAGMQIRVLEVGALLLAAAGMTGSLVHLGRPRQAWRAFLGLRTSWLSREIVALGAYAGTLLLAVICGAGSWSLPFLFPGLDPAVLFRFSSMILGVAAVGCSAMVYIDTPRPSWATPRTWMKFGSTGLIGASAGLLSGAVTGEMLSSGVVTAAVAFSLAVLGKLFIELSVFLPRYRQTARWRGTTQLLSGPLDSALRQRVAAAYGAILLAWMAAVFAPGGVSFLFAMLAFAVVVAGELAERFLFFASMTSPRMPGAQV